MAVRPVEFQAMIQNNHEPSVHKANENHRPMEQQQHVAAQNQQAVSLSLSQVGRSEESSSDTYDSSKGGDGTGYEGNKNRKDKEEEKKKEQKPLTSVKVKGAAPRFEASV